MRDAHGCGRSADRPLLTEACGPARTGDAGELVPLQEQDRTRWDRTAIAEGTALITRSLAEEPIGPYQVQAAVAAVHAEAPSVADTDRPQVLALYELLERLAPGPVVTLNRAVVLGEVRGPRAGDHVAAAGLWQEAAHRAGSAPERRYLRARATRA